MLQALLYGKLSQEQENLEDLLTSSVFGILEYLPPATGLIPILQLARFSDGSVDSVFFTMGLQILKIEFWPTYSVEAGSTEPDVVIWAQEPSGQRHIVLVEVKLWSSKSSRPDMNRENVTDQLGREWSVLVHLCKRDKSIPHLIYLTTDPLYPSFEINESANESRIKHPERTSNYRFRCAWLSWLQIEEEFHASEERVLRDISRACRKLDLVPFRGFSALTLGDLGWTFAGPNELYSFAVDAIPYEWRFR